MVGVVAAAVAAAAVINNESIDIARLVEPPSELTPRMFALQQQWSVEIRVIYINQYISALVRGL